MKRKGRKIDAKWNVPYSHTEMWYFWITLRHYQKRIDQAKHEDEIADLLTAQSLDGLKYGYEGFEESVLKLQLAGVDGRHEAMEFVNERCEKGDKCRWVLALLLKNRSLLSPIRAIDRYFDALTEDLAYVNNPNYHKGQKLNLETRFKAQRPPQKRRKIEQATNTERTIRLCQADLRKRLYVELEKSLRKLGGTLNDFGIDVDLGDWAPAGYTREEALKDLKERLPNIQKDAKQSQFFWSIAEALRSFADAENDFVDAHWEKYKKGESQISERQVRKWGKSERGKRNATMEEGGEGNIR